MAAGSASRSRSWRQRCTKRRVDLTEAGAAFLERARRALAEVEEARADARQAARGELGRLAVGFVGSAVYTVLPDLLRAYRARVPRVEVALRQMTTTEQVEALRDGRIGVGVLRKPANTHPAFGLEVIHREPLVAAVPATHPLAGRDDVSARDLADEAFVLFPRAAGPSLYDAIIALCDRAGFSPTVVQEAGEVQPIAGLVGAGLGVALVPASVERLRVPGVAYRAVREAEPTVALAVAWRRAEVSPTVRSFLSVVEETLTRPGETALSAGVTP